MPSGRRLVSIIAAIAGLYFFLHNGSFSVSSGSSRVFRSGTVDEAQQHKPADSTLGFDAVVAVSPKGSWRQKKLLQQAAISEVDIQIPELPEWTKQQTDHFFERLAYGGRESAIGSVMAWLSHHYILEWFLKSRHETILIMEDDMDWDIRLRTVQIPRAAAAMRSLLQPATSYWGNTKEWDVLYLGHCGDWLHKLEMGFDVLTPGNLTSRPHVIYEDPTLPLRQDLHPFSQKFFNQLEFRDHERAIHASGHPLCTFAYAVNRRAAKKIIKEIVPIDRPESFAFDAAMLLGCQHRGLRCFTVNPEIFHHMKGKSIIKDVENLNQEFLPPVDREGLEQTDQRGETSNIDCGFLGDHFMYDSKAQLQVLREEVGRKGKCLKPGRDQEPFDMAWRDT